ncbi:MAG: dockerin type I domain-containing protein [candidate division Zixibacteria bacterium]
MSKKLYLSGLMLLIIVFFGSGSLVFAQSDTCDAQLPGDANSDGIRDIVDLYYLKDFLCASGPAPEPLANGDANGDCSIDWVDLEYIYRHVNFGTPFTLECTCVSPTIGDCPDTCASQLIGDVDNDGILHFTDASTLFAFLHIGGPLPGPNADVNGDCIINIDDYNCLISYFPFACTQIFCTCAFPEIEYMSDSCNVQMPGDVDNNGQITIWDADYLIKYLNQTGPPPAIMANADPNGDCVKDSLDIIRIIGYMFKCKKEAKCGYTPVECTCQQPELGEYFQDPCFGELPGDANSDGNHDIGDAVYIINHVFKNGPAPVPYDGLNGDANCDCKVDVGDAVYMIAHIFKDGPGPCDCAEWSAGCDGSWIPIEWFMGQ